MPLLSPSFLLISHHNEPYQKRKKTDKNKYKEEKGPLSHSFCSQQISEFLSSFIPLMLSSSSLPSPAPIFFNSLLMQDNKSEQTRRDLYPLSGLVFSTYPTVSYHRKPWHQRAVEAINTWTPATKKR